MESKLTVVGTVELDSKSYQLVRTKESKGRSWNEEFQNEPPWDQAQPNLIHEPMFTWHLGGFKSRQGIQGTSEYGKNSDARFPFRLLPSPLINSVTLTGSTVVPTDIFESEGYIWVLAGRYVFRVDPTDNSVVVSKDFGAGVAGVMGLVWEADYALVTTNEATNSIWKVVAGTPDTWTQQSTGTYYPYLMAPGLDRLFVVNKAGQMKNISTGLDPLDGGNYADSVQCGRTYTAPNGLVAFDRTAFVGKPEGLFGVDQTGRGIPLLRRMAYHANNTLGMLNFEPYVLVPHINGIDRFIPGNSESVGLEKEIMNESPIKVTTAPVKSLATDGYWTYASTPVGSDNYILVSRERRSGEPSFGSLIWDTWLHFTNASICSALHVSATASPMRLWFGYGLNLAYVKLDQSEFSASASRFTARLNFDDWGTKDFPQVVAVGRNLDATTYWDVYFSVDGAAYSNLDIDGNPMRVNSAAKFTFYLPTSASGREIQYRLDYVSDDPSQLGELVYFDAYAIPRPKQVRLPTFQLLLATGIRHGDQIEHRSVTDQLNDLIDLRKSGAAISTTGPWGDALKVHVVNMQVVEAFQQGSGDPELLVQVSLQVREVAE